MAKAMRFLGGAVLALGLAFPALAEDAPTADTVIATVNGTAITLGHMIAARETLPEQYKTLPPDVLFKGILEQLIQQTVLQQSVEGQLTKGQTLQLENENRGFVSGVALQQVVTGAVTDEALQAAYDARFKDAVPQTEYNAAHILVETKEKADELKAQIEGGADFAELAKANSADLSAARGGDLGWLNPGDTVPEFERAMNALRPGEVSPVVRSPFGWHLIQVMERRLQDVTDERKRNAARNILRDRKADEAYEDWVRQLRDSTYVENRLERE